MRGSNPSKHNKTMNKGLRSEWRGSVPELAGRLIARALVFALYLAGSPSPPSSEFANKLSRVHQRGRKSEYLTSLANRPR